MNPKTRAILKALGFVEDECHAVIGITDFVREGELIAVPHGLPPDKLAPLLMNQAVRAHKNRVRTLREALRREER